MASCYKIFEYWSDKNITEKGEVSKTEGVRVVENLHDPSCFACGRPVDRRTVLGWDKYDKELKDLWSDKNVNSKLQKCHILAKQFGGSDTTDNLFLMCEDCHAESPDTKNSAAFFRWVYRRKKEFSHGFNWKKFMFEWESEITSRGYDFSYFVGSLNPSEGFEIADIAISNCGLHGCSIAPSSVVVELVSEMERRFLEKRKSEINMS